MASESKTGEIFKLLPKVMSEIGAIAKGRKNEQQGYAFRGIDDVYFAIQPAFVKHGVFCVPEVLEMTREERTTKFGSILTYTILKVCHTFYASDGSNVKAVTVGEAMDSGDKSANKAMSAAMKYACLEVFAIPTEGDNDTENQTHAQIEPKLASPDQVREIKDLLEIVRLPLGTVDKWFAKAGVDSWDSMPAATVGSCIKYVKGRLPKQPVSDGQNGRAPAEVGA